MSTLKYGFRRNPKLRPANYQTEWTPQLILEWTKCRDDPIYFIQTYVKVISKGELAPLILYDWQKKIILDYANSNRVIIGTARQAGKSTTTVSFILWYLIFHPYKTAAIVANKELVAAEMITKIQFAYEKLPFWLQMGVKTWKKKSLELENDSRVFAAATSASSISGFTVNFLFIDEVAKIEKGKWDDFWASTSQTLASDMNAKIAMVSTPLGLNHFWEFWDQAVKGISGYRWHKVTWSMVPGRNAEWKQQTLADLKFDNDKFAQEHEVEFLGSSGTLIAGWKLKELVERGVEVPSVATAHGIKQYEPAIRGHNYLIMADVAEGKGLDYSAAQVIDITSIPYRQVCTFNNNAITPYEYARILDQIGRLFNSACILVENNNIGSSVCNTLWDDFEYDNLLFTRSAKKGQGRARSGLEVILGADDGADGGVKTTTSVKSIGCNLLKYLVEQDKLIVRDAETISELSTFSRKMNKTTGQYGKTFQAEDGKFDDLVMGLVLFGWLTEQDYFKHEIHTLSHLKEISEEQMAEELKPFMFHDDGRGDEGDEMLLALWKPEDEQKRKLSEWPDIWIPDGAHFKP